MKNFLPIRSGSAERFLQLAIEALTDMGNHVVADLGLGMVDAYGDIPHLLQQSGYIDSTMQETWIRTIGFHNILVHDYLDVGREIVYLMVQDGLADIRRLRDMFARLL